MEELIFTEEQKVNLRKAQIELLDEVVRLSDKHNLKYYLLGGTCLGAARHGGFIPWDDDIDIGFARNDYEKFKNICKNELNEEYFYQDHTADSNYPKLYARLRKNNTTLKEDYFKNFKCHDGIYMDIFPLDMASNKMKKAEKIYNKIKFLRSINYIDGTNFNAGNTVAKVKYILRKVYKKLVSQKKIWGKIDYLVNKYNNAESKYFGNFLGNWGLKEVMAKEIMINPEGKETFLEFEGKMYRVPYDYDAYLTSLYGDYMTPPPVEKRVSHHGIVEINFDTTVN